MGRIKKGQKGSSLRTFKPFRGIQSNLKSTFAFQRNCKKSPPRKFVEKFNKFKWSKGNKNVKDFQNPQQKTLQKMALSGDYIPLDANASPRPNSSPKAGPSRVRTSPRKRPREEESDDEPLSVTKAKAGKSYDKRPKTFTTATGSLPKFAKEAGLCDSTTQIDGEKEIAVDLIKEEGDDPLDCSDVVVVSTYPNVTPRIVHPASEDDSVEIIPMLDDEESDDEVVEVTTAESSVIIVEDESDISAHVRIPSPKKGKKKKSIVGKKNSHGGGKPIPSGSNAKKQLPHVQQVSPKAPNKIRIVKENSSSAEKRPRFIVIDGSNVAFHHSLMKKVFSVEGLQIAIQYFEEKGHEVVAVVPVFRSKMRYSTNPDMLKDLNLKGKVIFSPAKNINGYTLSSYDDLLIMQVADKNKGVIISNDNFADLLGQNIAWDTIIGSRVIGFTWFKDQFFLPLDPYGRDGPKINDILYY